MPMFVKSCVAFSVALAATPYSVAGQGFLAPDMVSRDRVMDQLRSLLGHGQNRERLNKVEETLRPTYMALPKDGSGRLDHKAARYALYRYFLVHHGWHIKGLTMDVEENTRPVPGLMSKAAMPAFIMEMLEQHVGHRTGLDELTVLAATIEDLVHSDAVDILEMAYKTHSLSTDSLLDAEEADQVFLTFVLYFMLPSAQKLLDNPRRIKQLIAGGASKAYPGWQDAVLWVEDIKKSLEYEGQVSTSPFAASHNGDLSFTVLARWATTVSAGFGKVSNLECKAMKNALLELEPEERDDGRVRLDNFYAPYLAGGSFHFSESPEYLRHLGALDESVAKRPSVIVPNIMYSKSNCMATSGFHSVCCIDDCEVLMSDLEQHVSEPKAPADLIAHVVAGLSSETVAAPRNLSAPMMERLHEIAGRHGGSVPLHSRLFAQWMHYAFPNECPYPRSLLTNQTQLTSREWNEAKRTTKAERPSMATAQEMQTVVDIAQTVEEASETASVMALWSEDEELLSDVLETTPVSQRCATALRWIAGAAAVLASLKAMADAVATGRGDSADKKGSSDLPWFGRASAVENRAHYV